MAKSNSNAQLLAGQELLNEFYRTTEHLYAGTKSRKKFRLIEWETNGSRSKRISSIPTDGFDARGMRKIYERADKFGRFCLYMSVWRTSKGRLLARFWSYNDEVDFYSYEISGLSSLANQSSSTEANNEFLIPQCLRDEYESWAWSEIPYSRYRKFW